MFHLPKADGVQSFFGTGRVTRGIDVEERYCFLPGGLDEVKFWGKVTPIAFMGFFFGEKIRRFPVSKGFRRMDLHVMIWCIF